MSYLRHNILAVVVNALEAVELLVLLEDVRGSGVVFDCLAVGLELDALVQPCWQLEQELRAEAGDGSGFRGRRSTARTRAQGVVS